jgi:hypothetical protein
MQVQPASVQDHDGVPSVLKASQAGSPSSRGCSRIAFMLARKSQTPPPSWSRSFESWPIRSASKSYRAAARHCHTARESAWNGSGGGRARLCLDQPQSPRCQGFRGRDYLGHGLPLRRLHHAVNQEVGSFSLRFESDSQVIEVGKLRIKTELNWGLSRCVTSR